MCGEGRWRSWGVVLEVVSGDDELTCSRAPNNNDDVIAVVFLPSLTAWCGVREGKGGGSGGGG